MDIDHHPNPAPDRMWVTDIKGELFVFTPCTCGINECTFIQPLTSRFVRYEPQFVPLYVTQVTTSMLIMHISKRLQIKLKEAKELVDELCGRASLWATGSTVKADKTGRELTIIINKLAGFPAGKNWALSITVT